MHIPARVDEESGSPIHTRRDVVAQELQVVFATRLARAWHDNDQWENVAAEPTDAGSEGDGDLPSYAEERVQSLDCTCHYRHG